MDFLSRDECRAIYRELREAHLAARRGSMDLERDPERIAEWLQELNAEACYRMRETSSLWKVWRRLQEHRTLTGHSLPLLPLRPDAITNAN